MMQAHLKEFALCPWICVLWGYRFAFLRSNDIYVYVTVGQFSHMAGHEPHVTVQTSASR